jgi:hypothetical protein
MSFISKLLFGEPPAPPDYAKAATAQGEANIEAAKLNAAMNRLNETTPYGNVKYTTTPNSKTPGGFDYSRAITLSPEQQQLYNLESGNQISSQQIAQGLQQGVANSVGQPFNLGQFGDPTKLGDASTYAGGAKAVGDALYQREVALRQPQMERDVAGLDTQLKNQGLVPGSEAYDHSLQQLRQQQGQDLNDLAQRATLAQGQEQSRLGQLDLSLGGFNNQTRGQSIQESLLARQQPLAEFNAFRTGNAPTLPQFQPYGMTNAQPAPTFAGAQAQYGAGLDRYNAGNQGLQSLLNFGSSIYGAR